MSTLTPTGSGSPIKPAVDPNLFHSVLVHNITHSDLLLGLAPPPVPASHPSSPSPSPLTPTSTPSLPRGSLIAQPKFHRYQQITSHLARSWKAKRGSPVYFPSFHYNQGSSPGPSASTSPASSSLLPPTPPTAPFSTLPYGFFLPQPLPLDSWDGLRLRSSSSSFPLPPKPSILAFFFPMLSVLIPRWLQICDLKRLKREKIRELTTSASPSPATSPAPGTGQANQLYVYLVSGGGQPWDRTLHHQVNSTVYTAQLCQLFLSHFYPHVTVRLIHSHTDVFHYDGNVAFVNTQLLPRLQSHRRDLAALFYERWQAHLHTVITVTDGPPARVAAISASLRSFTPDCLHMWQLKSFWHEYPGVSGQGEYDVEYQNFEKLEMAPPIRLSDCGDDGVKETVARLVAFKQQFEAKRDSGDYNELPTFWMRKSKKPVLSVVMAESRRGGRRWYRGINMEVSMPTGSLCSERSAIGSALSDDVGLCRKDIKVIAVLALPLERKGEKDKEEEAEEKRKEEQLLRQMTQLTSASPLQKNHSGPSSPMSPFDLHSRAENGDVVEVEEKAGLCIIPRVRSEERLGLGGTKRSRITAVEDGEGGEDRGDGGKKRRLPRDLSITTERSLSSGGEGLDASPAFLAMAEKEGMREYLRQQQQLETELLLMNIRREHHSGDDEGRNPMNPCGACNEWLKKIAEVNPDFKVVTFTSTDCLTRIHQTRTLLTNPVYTPPLRRLLRISY